MRQFLMAFVVVIVVGVILLFATRWAWNQVFGHDEPLHDRITAAVDELDNDSSERQIRRELEDQDLDEDDAEMLAESISNALAEGVTVNEILDAIEDLDEDVSVRGVSREIDELVADMSPEDDESPTPPAEENGEQTDEPSTTPTPTPEGEDSEKSVDTGSMPEFVNESSQGSWTVKGSERLGDNPVVEAWISRLQDPAPELWKTYPNVPNPDVPGFRVVNGSEVPDGVEYGVANVPFCQQDTRCDFVVPGWHYRLITADYSFLGEECRGATEGGCLLLLINVGEETYTWRNQMADNGFSVPGRYWNGDALEWGVWGLVSHASANMLNMETQGLEDETLNSGVPANAGGNCGTVDGCDSVDVRVVVHAGDAVIAVLETEVTRP